MVIVFQANALQYLSDSDILSRMWTESQASASGDPLPIVLSGACVCVCVQEVRVSVQEYGSSVACRGLIHCNRSSTPPKWRPLHKPQWSWVFRQVGTLS